MNVLSTWFGFFFSGGIPINKPTIHTPQDLVDDIKSEISGDFEKTVLALMMLPAEFQATEVKRAIRGLGTDEAVLVELLCTKTNEEMTALKDAYKKCESE